MMSEAGYGIYLLITKNMQSKRAMHWKTPIGKKMPKQKHIF